MFRRPDIVIVLVVLVIGDREKENGQVAVRTLSGEDLGVMSLDAFIERLQAGIPLH